MSEFTEPSYRAIILTAIAVSVVLGMEIVTMAHLEARSFVQLACDQIKLSVFTRLCDQVG